MNPNSQITSVNTPYVVRLSDGQYAIARLLPKCLFYRSSYEANLGSTLGLIWCIEDVRTQGYFHTAPDGKLWEVEEIIMELPIHTKENV